MSNIYIFILLSIVLIGLNKERNMYNPTVIFAGTWLLIGFLCSLHLYEMNPTSDYAYFVALCGIICFAIGCMIRNKIKIKVVKFRGINAGSYNKLKYQFLITFYLLIILFTIPLFIRSISLLRRGVLMETIRFNYRNLESGMIIKSAIVYDIECYIVAPAEFVAVVLLPIVVMDVKSKKKLVLLTELFLFLFLHLFVTGARSFIIEIAIVFAIYSLINRQLIKFNLDYFKKIPKIIFVLIAIVSIALVIVMTSMRKGDKSIIKEIYCYFSISFPLLDVHLRLMNENPDFTYGMTLLQGLLRPFVLVLKMIGISTPRYNHARDLVALNDVFYPVGRGSANSFVTVFYYFYMDFGLISVILGSLWYGYISQSFYLSMIRRPNRRNQAMYLLIALGLFLSFSRAQFTAYRYVYAFFLLLLCFLREDCNRNICHEKK